MMFSYLAKQRIEELGWELVFEGELAMIRRIGEKEVLSIRDEKPVFMYLYEKHGLGFRAQYRTRDGFWGFGLRNDGKRWDWSVPQGLEDHEYESVPDTWPRMYTQEWLNNDVQG